MKKLSLSRRQFLAGTATVSSSLVLGLSLSSQPAQAHGSANSSVSPNAWLEITPENKVIFQLDKTEMGQGVLTGLPTILAEELEIDPRKIEIQMAMVNKTFQDPIQITGGSNSIASRWDALRDTGATAKDMLLKAAAMKWDTDKDKCYAEDGVVYLKDSAQSATFGELASTAGQLKAPKKVTLKSPEDFKYIGKSLRRFDGSDKSMGLANFGIDVQLDNLVNAVVLRNPHFSKQLFANGKAFDAEQARQANGVIDVIGISNGIAVIADTYWHARSAAKLVKANWFKGDLAGLSSDKIRSDWQEKAKSKGKNIEDKGDGFKGLSTASKVLEAAYEVPYLSHAPMEPQNTTAHYKDGVMQVYSPNQGPDVAQAMICEALGLKRKQVIVHTTLMGGGFGRRGIPDFAVEAAEIAMHLETPVKVIWSREDDMRHDFYRPATYNVMKAGLDQNGMVQTWHHKLVAPSMMRHIVPVFAGVAPTWMPNWMVSTLVSGVNSFMKQRDPTTTEGADNLPYDIANIDVQHVFHDPGIPLGFWRSVGHSQNAFFTESFIDELAHAANADPYEFRKQLLKGHARHLKVLDLVAEKSNWGKNSDHPQGIAVHESFGSVVAEVVDIKMIDGKPVIEKVTCAIDCGLAVNPDLVKAQVESAVIFGLTAALKGEITIKDGAVEQSNFHDYQMIRMHEAPDIEVYIVPGGEKPSGVGEPGTPPIAPAVANALFAATGQRQRSLPLSLV